MLKFQETDKHVAARFNSVCSDTTVAQRYTIWRKLGNGSFGNVYLVSERKAKQEELRVLKKISIGDLKPNETIEANMEAQLLSKLGHPAIVRFYASFVERDSFCIITEYREELEEYWHTLRFQEMEKMLSVLICCVVYDVVSVFDRKMRDFGVSRLLMGSCDLATTFTGTPYYMSPEALKHQGYNTKSDICMLNKNASLRPAAAEIIKVPYIDEQLKNMQYKFTNMTVKDKAENWQKEGAPIFDAIPEDPEIAEEYYNDEFESCSEGSEEEEDAESSQTVSKTNHQEDSDTEAMVKYLESVLSNSSIEITTVCLHAHIQEAAVYFLALQTHLSKTNALTIKANGIRFAIEKLGVELFETMYSYLKQARQQNASEVEIRRRLEKLVSRASDCFEVDQLLYFEEQLQASESCLQV